MDLRIMSEREKFPTRTIRLSGRQQLDTAMALLAHMPLDAERPIQVIVREEVKPRKLSQQALMFAGPLADIAEQAYIGGRAYSADVWHHHYKVLYLPEEFNAELCREGYRKWDYSPAGERVLIGSTTQLTTKGMAQYIEQIMADGAGMGVMFHSLPNEAAR